MTNNWHKIVTWLKPTQDESQLFSIGVLHAECHRVSWRPLCWDFRPYRHFLGYFLKQSSVRADNMPLKSIHQTLATVHKRGEHDALLCAFFRCVEVAVRAYYCDVLQPHSWCLLGNIKLRATQSADILCCLNMIFINFSPNVHFIKVLSMKIRMSASGLCFMQSRVIWFQPTCLWSSLVMGTYIKENCQAPNGSYSSNLKLHDHF